MYNIYIKDIYIYIYIYIYIELENDKSIIYYKKGKNKYIFVFLFICILNFKGEKPTLHFCIYFDLCFNYSLKFCYFYFLLYFS